MKQFGGRIFFVLFFVMALFGAELHQHNDLQAHNDCPLHFYKTNLQNFDTPQSGAILTDLELASKAIFLELVSLTKRHIYTYTRPRSPPTLF